MGLSQKEIERRIEASQRASEARREQVEQLRWWRNAGLLATWALALGIILVIVAMGINVAHHI